MSVIRLEAVVRMLACGSMVAALGGTMLAQGAPLPTLESQLKTMYKLSQVEWVGNNVTQQGTILTLAKGNLLFATPEKQVVVCSATVKEDKDQLPASICRLTMKSTGSFLQAGQRLYLTKIKVNVPKDTVTFELAEAAADQATGAVAQPSFKTAVNFVFSGGYLSKADAGQVADVITKTLALDTNTAAAGQPAPQQAPEPQPQQQQIAQAPPPPAQVELGMTEDQVKTILGSPTTSRQSAAKTKVYVYRKQITFQDGRVAAIE